MITVLVRSLVVEQVERTLRLLCSVKEDALEQSAIGQQAAHEAELSDLRRMLVQLADGHLSGNTELIGEIVESTLLDTLEHLVDVAGQPNIPKRDIARVADGLERASALAAMLHPLR